MIKSLGFFQAEELFGLSMTSIVAAREKWHWKSESMQGKQNRIIVTLLL